MNKFLPKLKKYIRITALAFMIMLLSNCKFSIDTITQPSNANVNDVITVKLNTTFKDLGALTKRIVVAVLAPKGWKIGQNGNTTISYTSPSFAPGTLSLIPSTQVAGSATNGENWPTLIKKKVGIGPNYIDDMEWVAFQTQPISVGGGTYTAEFTLKIKVGADGKNVSAKLGYLVCNDTDGLDAGQPDLWPYKFADCLAVTGGTGDLIDFCNPSLTTTVPAKVLDNDYVSITFDNTVVSTQLAGATATYLCATAHTSNGQNITICSQDNKTKMPLIAPDKYQITIWPRGYFGVTDAQTITSIDYFITDQTGTKKVGYGNNSLVPFSLKFVCD